MEHVRFNNLPLSVVPPAYPAYEADTLESPAVSRLAMLLFSPGEKRLRQALARLADYDEGGAAGLLQQAVALAPEQVDAHLLLGMLALRENRFAPAEEHLERVCSAGGSPGLLIRRLVPTLRILLRVSRFQFFPVYPDYYGASLMLALARWKTGRRHEALEVLRGLQPLTGWRDEMRVLAAEIHLELNRPQDALAALEREEGASRDELDVTIHLLRGLAQLALGNPHQAAIALRSDAAYSLERNPYLTTIAKFLYSQALERDGLVVLALRESTALRLRCVLNPEVRKYVRWRELRLRERMGRMSGEALLNAAEFKWFVSREKVADESLLEVVPQDVEPRPIALSQGPPQTLAERLRQLDELLAQSRRRAGEADATEPVMEPPPEFDASGVHDWSLAASGDEEMCSYDFRSTRQPPLEMAEAERRLKKLEERAVYAGVAIMFLLFVFKGCF